MERGSGRKGGGVFFLFSSCSSSSSFFISGGVSQVMQNKNHPVRIPLDDKKVEPPFLSQLSFCRKSFPTSSTRSRSSVYVSFLFVFFKVFFA